MTLRTPALSASCVLVLVSILALAPVMCVAEEAPSEGATTETITVDDLAWLAGDWHGKVGDSTLHETWSEPAVGAMMGMFRWLDGDSVRLYELLAIQDTPAGPVLYLRHFARDLVAWEEKDAPSRFTLVEADVEADVEAGARRVVFRTADQPPTGLAFERRGDVLTVTLSKVRDGEAHDTVFTYQRR